LAVHCLNSQFDLDHNKEPYFFCLRRKDGTGEMRHNVEIGIPHIVGRSMLGSQMAELKAGIPFPEEGFKVYEYYCKQSFDNPDNLNSYYKGSVRGVEMHNMREGLWSLWALIIHSNSEWAKDKAHKMLQSLEKITDANGNWSGDLAKKAGFAITGGMAPVNQSRMLDPLMAYYSVTNDPLALKLAGIYARVSLNILYDDKGRFTEYKRSGGHIHSITSSLSGIIRYAILTRNQNMIDKCIRVMDNGIPEYFSSWGWGKEVMPVHPANVNSQGEINQTGDITRAALYLGAAGYPRYYEVAERFLRSMLLPAQLWPDDVKAFMKENDNPKDDTEKDIVNRCTGGFGFPLPNARMRGGGSYPVESQDITSGGVHALSECWGQIFTSTGKSSSLNLLFDWRNADFDIKSYLPLEGRIEIHAKAAKILRIRIPDWVDLSTLKLTIEGKPATVKIENSYIEITGLTKNKHASVTFDLPCRNEEETVDGTVYKTAWIGNQIIKISPGGVLSPLPF
jgi:hypothetical protein